jgi:hypothetical protein
MTTNQGIERICAFQLDGLGATAALTKVILAAEQGQRRGTVGSDGAFGQSFAKLRTGS